MLHNEVGLGLQEEGLWFWDFEGNKMFYDVEEQVRFRVKTVKFQKPPSVQELRSKGGEDDLSGTAAKPIAIMQVRFLLERYYCPECPGPSNQVWSVPTCSHAGSRSEHAVDSQQAVSLPKLPRKAFLGCFTVANVHSPT